jgi:hypothetical protein
MRERETNDQHSSMARWMEAAIAPRGGDCLSRNDASGVADGGGSLQGVLKYSTVLEEAGLRRNHRAPVARMLREIVVIINQQKVQRRLGKIGMG